MCGKTKTRPPWSYSMVQFAETVTRARRNDDRGIALYMIGALKRLASTGTGVRHMSVDGMAVSWNDVDVRDGGAALLFMILKGS